jgi:phosphoribosylanthranilate isomerase
MTEIKICGITNLKDARRVFECGADALGFIFHPESPRYLTPGAARKIIKGLPAEITKVGVFVNREYQVVKGMADYCGLDIIQLHGDETPEYCSSFPPFSLIKAVSKWKDTDLRPLSKYPVKAFLVDSRDQEHYGGTGIKSDWTLAKKIGEIKPLILAGGLNAENIREAIETVSPDAVDIASGVEISPGKKDHEKMRELIDIVRAMNRKGRTRIFRA